MHDVKSHVISHVISYVSSVDSTLLFIWLTYRGSDVKFHVPEVRFPCLIAAVKEYCQMETFKPECGRDSVVVMERARYGRMRMGRCVTKNYGNIGCNVDVRSYVDTLCSGRQSCEIKVPDERMFEQKPCVKDVTAYLEASYRCQKGECGRDALLLQGCSRGVGRGRSQGGVQGNLG